MRARLAKSAVVIGLLVVSMAGPVQACSVCFGDAQSPIAAGMNLAIWTLLGVTGGVLGSVAAFFAMLIRRGQRTLDRADVGGVDHV